MKWLYLVSLCKALDTQDLAACARAAAWTFLCVHGFSLISSLIGLGLCDLVWTTATNREHYVNVNINDTYVFLSCTELVAFYHCCELPKLL